jgi:lipoate-protein ligase A
MQKWRLINSGEQSGSMNMALDEALLNSVAGGHSPPVLRFYRWRPATVTLGYAQSVHSDLDLEVCTQAGLDIVRRSTGGRAVLHAHEVTYSVISPLNTGVFGGSVLECYRVISAVLQKTLLQLGLSADLVPGKPRGGHQNAMKAVCFSAPSQYELVIEGRKVAGSAQKRHGQAFLQHGSIPLEMDLELLGKALKTGRDKESSDSLQSVGWLNRWSKKKLTIDEVETVLADEFSRHLQVEWDLSGPTVSELQEAELLCTEKFSCPEWILKR